MTIRAQTARDLLTVAVAISAGVHAALAPEHWRERPALGVGFALATVLLAASGVAVQASTHTLAAIASAGVLAGLTVVYVVSRTHGLALTGREEWDSVGIATQVVQLGGIAFALSLLHPIPSPIRGGARAHA